jgi:hypothetical protein
MDNIARKNAEQMTAVWIKNFLIEESPEWVFACMRRKEEISSSPPQLKR